MHINCRSLNKNFKSLCNLLARCSGTLTAVGVTETWLSPNFEDNFCIDRYKFVSKSRTNKLGGGVGLFIDNQFDFHVRNDLTFMKDFLECIFVEISQQNTSDVIIGCIYRPPNTDVSLFNSDLLVILNILNKYNKMPVFIMGDFNLDLLHSDSHAPTGAFLSTFSSYSFLPTSLSN